MKVVLFCGGLGTRLGELTEDVPKPLVKIGYRPILWHLMKYYAHFGHKDFILCLGFKADRIKDYFLNYNEYVSNDFTMTDGGRQLQLHTSDIADWRITFVDTGLRANIGQRLKAVEKYLDGEHTFLANYADGLTDLPLPLLIEFAMKSGKTACFLCARPPHSYHVIALRDDHTIGNIRHVRDTPTLINGGFFVFNRKIFEYMRPGEELVEQPFQRLIAANDIVGYQYENWWCMDTFKEHQVLSDMHNQGNAPWEVWIPRNGEIASTGT
jgi:glucose-1-phosphate cytidylyltransferase